MYGWPWTAFLGSSGFLAAVLAQILKPQTTAELLLFLALFCPRTASTTALALRKRGRSPSTPCPPSPWPGSTSLSLRNSRSVQETSPSNGILPTARCVPSAGLACPSRRPSPARNSHSPKNRTRSCPQRSHNTSLPPSSSSLPRRSSAPPFAVRVVHRAPRTSRKGRLSSGSLVRP